MAKATAVVRWLTEEDMMAVEAVADDEGEGGESSAGEKGLG